jgi:hypothetical protein
MDDLPAGADDEVQDPISEFAQKRRAEAEAESARPKPDFIQSVDQSEVVFTLSPAGIPFRQTRLAELNASLQTMYGLQVVGPDFSPLLKTMSRDQLAAMDEAELYGRLMRANDTRLRWEEGRFPLRDDYVAIQSVNLNYESVHVVVRGVSQIADVIVKEIIEKVWELAGSKKKFSDVEPLVQLVAYGTRTRLSLGYGPECLLNPRLLKYLDDSVTSGNGFATAMGRTRANADGPDPVFAIAALDDLQIVIRKFNQANGYSEDAKIGFSVTAQSDFRTGRLLASTGLPYEQHVALLSSLFTAVRE